MPAPEQEDDMKQISQQSSYSKRLSALTHIYLDLSLSIREAVQAAEADLRQLGLIHSLSVECSDDALEVVELFRPSFSSGRPEIRVN
jgi:hypothetical protein